MQPTLHVGYVRPGIMLLYSPQLGREDGEPGLLLLGPRVRPGELCLELIKLLPEVNLPGSLGVEGVG